MSLVRSSLAIVASLSLLAGCAASHDAATDDGPVADEPSQEALSTKKYPLPAVATQHLYFPNTSAPLPYLGGSKAWPYPAPGETTVKSAWVFGALGGTTFELYVQGYDDGDLLADAPMSLTVYYLYGGHWRKYASAKGKGTAKLTVSPTYAHQWMVLANGDVGSDSNNLEIGLSCDSGVDSNGHSLCAVALEPGDACTGTGCDVNLFCDHGSACIGAGKCTPTPTSCATKGVSPMPACGCDGTTYASDCAAHAAGVSVASEGVCGSTPPSTCDWNGLFVTGADLQSHTWKSDDLKYTYTFAADGTFSSVYDMCAAPPGKIHCEVAAQNKTGKYIFKGVNITLQYDDGGSTNLVLQQDCAANERLDGTDWGTHVDALRLTK